MRFILCFSPPPIFTASLSKNLKPGAVFLVAKTLDYEPVDLTSFLRLFVCVAIPHILERRFSAVLSHVKMSPAFPLNSKIV